MTVNGKIESMTIVDMTEIMIVWTSYWLQESLVVVGCHDRVKNKVKSFIVTYTLECKIENSITHGP